MPAGHKARAEQVILFSVSARDANCPQHIPRRLEAADVTAALEAELAGLRRQAEAQPDR